MSSPGDSRFVDAVREAADLPGLVADYVALKKAGAGKFKALCPFHAEKTPSFHVDGQKQLFYCFGCGLGGDAFKFLMLQERVDFLEAVKLIARKHGIPVPARGGDTRGEDQVLFDINEAACSFYRDQLHADGGAEARRYLLHRGMESATLDRFQIGYAPDRWDGIKEHLRRRGFRERDLLRSGLLVKKEATGHTYDRFRNRILFPIRGLSERCIGFGGRILAEGIPKYLNSPESPIFDKSRTLYGLDVARPSIRSASSAILVEGYLDFLTLYQAGIETVVATLGTAFGPGHAKILRRFAEGVVVNFDPDAAGASATRRSLDILLEEGFDVRILRLPKGEDPDAFVRRKGGDAYRGLIEGAPTYLEDLIQEAAGKHQGDGPKGKLLALHEVLPFIAKLESSVVRLSFAGPLAEVLGLDEGSVLEELRVALKGRKSMLRKDITEPFLAANQAECNLVRLLLENRDFRQEVLKELDEVDLKGSPAAGLIATVRKMEQEKEAVTYPGIHQRLAGEEDRNFLARIASSDQPLPSEKEGWGCFLALRQRRISRAMKGIQREIDKGRGEVNDLLKQKMELGKELEKLAHGPSRTMAPLGASH
ncbi:MAG: DNA primase [Acidobacteria bacterium]|nr:DNA primase [Acidobacteriota bacterium]